MDMIKFDDPRLDESALFLFAFKKGDIVIRKDDPSLRGTINDGVYLGKFPKPTAASVSPGGKTLYEIAYDDQSVSIFDETEIEKVEAPDSPRDNP